MDITDLILDEHGEQRKLFGLLDQIDPSDTPALSAIWGRLHHLLDTHAEGEERFFYPRLLQIGTGGNDASSAEEETEDAIKDHNKIRDTAEAVDGHPVGSDAWFKAVGDCNKENEDHLAEEERQGLTDFRRHASVEERHALGIRFAAYGAEHLMGVQAVDKDPKTWLKEHQPG